MGYIYVYINIYIYIYIFFSKLTRLLINVIKVTTVHQSGQDGLKGPFLHEGIKRDSNAKALSRCLFDLESDKIRLLGMPAQNTSVSFNFPKLTT